MKFKVKAIMLDLDGTLIHTAPEIAEAANGMRADLGLSALNAKLIEGYIGEGAATLIKRCLVEDIGELDAEQSANAYASFSQHYAKIVADSQPYDNVLESLQDLKQVGYRLACVTNKPESFTLPLLQKSGLNEYFELVVSGDSLPKKKPDPLPLIYVCEQFNILPQSALLVGDSKTDVAAAWAAGCYVFTVPYGYNGGVAIEAHEVDAQIDSLLEITALIEHVN